MKFTIRELFLFVFCIAAALTALRLGGVFASVVIVLFSTVTLAITIIAFVGRDQRKVFAIGYVITVVLYGGIHFASGKNELIPYSGRLLTTRLISPLYQVMATGTWVDSATGEEMPEGFHPSEDPKKYIVFGGSGFGAGGSRMTGGRRMVWYRKSVDSSTFITVAHMLIAALLGWLGGKFAVYVHNTPEKLDST